MFARVILLVSLLAASLHAVSAQTSTTASYCVGLNVDGDSDEWDSCSSPEIMLNAIQVGLPGTDMLPGGMRARFAHDSTNIYVLLIVAGDYHLNLSRANDFSHSVAVMWKVGPDATMLRMGGCQLDIPNLNDPYNCTRIQNFCEADSSQCTSCRAHMTDVWHMESASPGSIPGVQYPYRGPYIFPNGDSIGYDPTNQGVYQPSVERLYNGNDHTSNSDDEFSVHPCLRSDDGSMDAHLTNFRNDSVRYGNELVYAWSHSAINSYRHPFAPIGERGYYTYEFSRPLTTRENTDVQFRVGEEASFSFGFWIPPNSSVPWEDANHYVAPSSLIFGTVELLPMTDMSGDGSMLVAPVLTFLLVSVLAVFTF